MQFLSRRGVEAGMAEWPRKKEGGDVWNTGGGKGGFFLPSFFSRSAGVRWIRARVFFFFCLEYLGGEMWGRTANGGGGNLPMKKVKI